MPINEADIQWDEMSPIADEDVQWDDAPKEEPQVSTLDYYIDRFKKGFSGTLSTFMEGAGQGQLSMGDAMTNREPLAPQTGVSAAQLQKEFAGVQNIPAPSTSAKYVGGAIEAIADPLSYVQPGGVLSKIGLTAAGGAGAEAGADIGSFTERKLRSGEESGAGRVAGSLIFGVGTPVVSQISSQATLAPLRVGKQIWDKHKAVRLDPKGAEDAVAAGAAKRILEQAASAQGADNIETLMADISKASKYVTGKEAPLLIGALDNPVLRDKYINLVRTNPEFRQRVDEELKNIAIAIDNKSNKIFGSRYAAQTLSNGVNIDNVQRKVANIDAQLEKLTSPTVVASGVDVSRPVAALIEKKKGIVAKELSSEYENLKAQARADKVTMGEDATKELYNFVEGNRLRDIFGRGTEPEKKIASLLSPKTTVRADIDPNIAALEKAAGLESKIPTTQKFKEMSFDDVDSLKRLVNDRLRVVKDPAQITKLEDLKGMLSNVRERYLPEKYNTALKEIDSQYYERMGIPFRNAQGIKDIDSVKYASQVAPTLLKNKEAVSDFLNVAGEQGRTIINTAVLAKAYSETVKDGLFNPTSLANFIKKNTQNGILKQVPEAEAMLKEALIDNRVLIRSKHLLDNQAQQAQKRIADNWLTRTAEPDFNSLTSKFMSNGADRAKIMRDLKDLSPESSKAVMKSIRAEIVSKARESGRGGIAYLTAPENKAAISTAMGTGYQERLKDILKLSDALKVANVDNLTVQLTKSQTDAVGKLVGGLDIPFVASTLRDRISSTPQKVVRLLSRINVSSINDKTDKQLMELFLDPDGIKKLSKVATELNFKIKNPIDLKKVVDTFVTSLPAKTYISLMAPEEQEQQPQQ
tara:strand:- start:26 stop:2623 length:2598 start_codon:yes stop_codon:yes gene_type:complete